uniref:(northern house mosquito) hypothetical protein n=1 Tax=Culex pipiens TaxID=7175 RepID=A0A8D8GYW5_CULPI
MWIIPDCSGFLVFLDSGDRLSSSSESSWVCCLFCFLSNAFFWALVKLDIPAVLFFLRSANSFFTFSSSITAFLACANSFRVPLSSARAFLVAASSCRRALTVSDSSFCAFAKRC